MKRTSVLAVIGCLLFASNALAWYSYTPFRYRVRYSPQAFGYRHSGLIPGDTRYSMHAVGRSHSGLVSEWVRYSPYAFGTRHNGLIVAYGDPTYGWWTPSATPVTHPAEMDKPRPLDVTTLRSTSRRARAPRASIRKTGASTTANGWTQPSRINQRRIIQDYLRQTRPGTHRFARSFKIDAEYATFDVLLDDGRVIVKYWNPGFIAELKSMEGGIHKRYQRYVQSWNRMCSAHEAGGGKVYHIVSNDADQVMEQICQIVEGTSSTDRAYCAALPPLGP